MNEQERAALAALSDADLDFLRSLSEEQRAKLVRSQNRTVGDMSPEEFVSMQAEGFSSALRTAFEGLGAGRVDRTALVGGRVNADAEPADQHRETMVIRSRLALVNHPEMRGLSVEARDAKIEGFLQVGEWVQAASAGDRERMEAITRASYMDAGIDLSRAIGSGAASAGSLIPLPLQGPIIEKRDIADKITPRSMQNRSDSGQVQLSAEDVQIVANGVAENADGSAGEVDVTYDPITLVKKKVVAMATSAREVVFDAAQSMQFVQNIARQAGRKIGLYNNLQNMTGDGSGTNFTDGILNNAGVNAPVGSGGAAARSKILQLRYGIAAGYWDNLMWLADPDTLAILSALEDGGGRPIYPNLQLNQTQALSGDEPAGFGSIEGIGIIVMDNADMGGILVLANLDMFATLVEDGIRVETTTEGGSTFVNDQQQWKFVERQDGAVALAEGFVKTDAAVS